MFDLLLSLSKPFLSVWRLAADFVLVWLETAIGRVVSFDYFTVFKVIFIIN